MCDPEQDDPTPHPDTLLCLHVLLLSGINGYPQLVRCSLLRGHGKLHIVPLPGDARHGKLHIVPLPGDALVVARYPDGEPCAPVHVMWETA